MQVAEPKQRAEIIEQMKDSLQHMVHTRLVWCSKSIWCGKMIWCGKENEYLFKIKDPFLVGEILALKKKLLALFSLKNSLTCFLK